MFYIEEPPRALPELLQSLPRSSQSLPRPLQELSKSCPRCSRSCPGSPKGHPEAQSAPRALWSRSWEGQVLSSAMPAHKNEPSGTHPRCPRCPRCPRNQVSSTAARTSPFTRARGQDDGSLHKLPQTTESTERVRGKWQRVSRLLLSLASEPLSHSRPLANVL